MRAVITGVGGFVGRHLLRHLEDEGDDVYGFARSTDVEGLDQNKVVCIDLFDRPSVERAIRETRPEAVYHLAAQSSPAESMSDPWATICNSLACQFNLLEALVGAGLRSRVLVVGSSDEYG